MSEKVKKPLYKRWWVWVVAVIIVLGVAGNLSEKNNNTSTSGNTPTNTEKTAKVETPEIVIDADELAKAFEENEIKANQDYKGKLAEITGTVKSIDEMLGSTFIVLSEKDFEIVNVQCFFSDKEQINKIAEISKGDKVTVIGKIDGKSINVSVKDCKFKE